MKSHQGRISHHDDGNDMVRDIGGSPGSISRSGKRKSEEEAKDERPCEDSRVITGMERKAEEDIDLEIICCVFEEPLEANAAPIEEPLECNEGVLEEKAWSWADDTEVEENDRNGCEEEKTFHDDLAGRALKYGKVKPRD